VYHTLGVAQARLGDEPGSLGSLRKAVALGEADVAARAGDADALSRLARIQGDLIERLQRRGDVGEAATVARSAIGTLEELVSGAPTNARYRRDLIYALNVGSEAIEAAGDAAGATTARRRSLELAEALLAAEPGNQGDRIALTYTLQYLGAGLVQSGQVEEGLERLRQAHRTAETVVAADRHNAWAQGRLAAIDAELAFALSRLRIRPTEMCSSLRRSAGVWGRLDREGRLPGEIRPMFGQVQSLLRGCPADTR
jgi:tetratricopeptide (TPR) repeat protein